MAQNPRNFGSPFQPAARAVSGHLLLVDIKSDGEAPHTRVAPMRLPDTFRTVPRACGTSEPSPHERRGDRRTCLIQIAAIDQHVDVIKRQVARHVLPWFYAV